MEWLPVSSAPVVRRKTVTNVVRWVFFLLHECVYQTGNDIKLVRMEKDIASQRLHVEADAKLPRSNPLYSLDQTIGIAH